MNHAYLHETMRESDVPIELHVGTNALRLDVQDGLLIVSTMDARFIWIPLSNVKLMR